MKQPNEMVVEDPLAPQRLRDFAYADRQVTRWADNDMYGHLNNATYYQLFDTTINAWIAAQTDSDFASTPAIGVVAESACRFHSQVSFPGPVTVALRVQRIGRTSVTYTLGLFAGTPEPETHSAATGHWVHVYVDRSTGKTTPIPTELRAALERLGQVG